MERASTTSDRPNGTELLPSPPPRLELESGNFANLREGIIHVHLANGQELFGVSEHMIAFEISVLNAVMQVYLLGFSKGRSHESSKLEGKLTTMIKLIFDK